MLTKNDVIKFTLKRHEMSLLKKYVEANMFNGISRIRKSNDRVANLADDQWVGQIGEYTLAKYLTGNVQNYIDRREKINLTPDIGDDGSDLDGCNVDIKSSKIRYEHIPISKYHLMVRPREFHKQTVYIHALVDLISFEAAKIYLTGWALGEDLLPFFENGDWGELYKMEVSNLKPLPKFNWTLPYKPIKNEE